LSKGLWTKRYLLGVHGFGAFVVEQNQPVDPEAVVGFTGLLVGNDVTLDVSDDAGHLLGNGRVYVAPVRVEFGEGHALLASKQGNRAYAT